MVEVTLLAGAGLALVAAVIYAGVATLLRRRKPSGEAGRANALFAVWWLALAAYTVVTTAGTLAGALGHVDVRVHSALLYTGLLLLCVGLWALLYYLLFLFTGHSALLKALTAFYAAYYLVLVVVLASANPQAVQVNRFTTTLVYENPLSPLATSILLAGLIFPPIVGALAYGSLYFRFRNPTRRFRVAVVSGSILVWFVSSYLATAAGVNQQDWWVLASRLLGLSAALAVLAAYHPPRFLRERFGLTTLRDEAKPDAPPAEERSSPPAWTPLFQNPAPLATTRRG